MTTSSAEVPVPRLPGSLLESGQSGRRASLAVLCAGLLLAGCTPYRFGTNTLFPPEIRTVYVPIFDSQSYRRNLGEGLTEAVIKEIISKTPYKVVSSPNADSVLSGRLISDTKTNIVESPTDEGRLTELNFVVEVQWIDRRGQMIRQMPELPVPAALVSVSQSGRYVPEVGSTYATAREQAFQDLAEQIVGLMETPW